MTADQLNSNLFGSAAITHNPLEQFVVLAKTAKGNKFFVWSTNILKMFNFPVPKGLLVLN